MGRILALDYGKKRIGIAVTDPLKITANGIDTVTVSNIREFITAYLCKETVETLVVGLPKQNNFEASESEKYIRPFIRWFSRTYPDIRIERVDERFTSQLARKALIDGGKKKIARRDKSLVDKISAVIILQSYMEILQNRNAGRLE